MTCLLATTGLDITYGKVFACRDISIDVAEGEIVTLIGANGAGKSTLMMTIFGKPKARAGQIIGFTGIDDPYEPPLAPEVTCETALEPVRDSLAAIVQALDTRGLLG